MEMTRQEMFFLKKIYMDGARIEQGRLYSYQEKTLRQYRFALAYLGKKYPDYHFTIVQGEPMNAVNTCAKFSFREMEGDALFDLHISEEKDALKGEDNFYGKLIRKAYDHYLGMRCEGIFSLPICFYSIIAGVKGLEYDENMTVNEIVNGSRPISPLTEIFLSGTEITEEAWEVLKKSVEEKMQEIGLYGSYLVYYLTDVSEGEMCGEICHNNLKAKDCSYKCSFQLFNRQH